MPSIKVTVMVEKAVPLAATPVLGLADTEELYALTAPATKVTWACCVMFTPPTLALIVLIPARLDFRTAVVRPFASVGAGVVSKPAPIFDKETV